MRRRGDDTFDFKGKRILITHPFLYEINGATIVTLELATFLQEHGAKVCVYTNVFEDPIKQYFSREGIRVDVANKMPRYHLSDFDFVWINSQTFPVSLLKELGDADKVKLAPKFIFMHMSAHSFCADEMPYIYGFEESLSSLSLFVSEEAFDTNKVFFEKLPENTDYYRNPAPLSYGQISKKYRDELMKVLVVANFPCSELREIKDILEKRSISIDYLGFCGDRYELINERIISKYDAVISIGKTVQYCLVSGIPVYIYGQYGGPGWLNKKNYAKAKKYNFSGRGFRDKTPEEIVNDLILYYSKAKGFHHDNLDDFADEYLIDNVATKVFRKAAASRRTIKPLSSARVAAHTSLLRLVEIDFGHWYVNFRNATQMQQYDELMNKKRELENINRVQNEILQSRSIRAWLKLNRIIRRKK